MRQRAEPRPHSGFVDAGRWAEWGGLATFSGGITTVLRPAREVSKLLTSGLHLDRGARHLGGEDLHPLVFVFGEMKEGGAHFGGLQFSSHLRYREAAIMIPFVVHVAHAEPALFSYRMFADDMRPVVLGNSVYGLRKQRVTIDWDGASYRAHKAGESLFHCTGGLLGTWFPWGGDAREGLRWLLEVFRLPILGLRDAGHYVGSRFAWDVNETLACSLDARVSWCPAAGERPCHASSEAGYSFAVKNLRWQTSAPRAIS